MAVNNEESQTHSKSTQTHSKSTQSHYLKTYAKLPLHIKVALSAFLIFIVREHTHMNISAQTYNMLCK